MIRPTFPSALRALAAGVTLGLLGLAACDTDATIVVAPEFEESFGFESGLEGWTVRSADLPLSTSVGVGRSTGGAAEGQGWVRILASAEELGGRVWIERPFEVTPEQSYDVSVAFALSSTDDAVEPWDVVLGAATAPATGSSLAVRGSTAPEESGVWEAREHVLTVTSGTAEAGEETATVWVALGVDILTGDERVYGLDEIEVSFVRN